MWESKVVLAFEVMFRLVHLSIHLSVCLLLYSYCRHFSSASSFHSYFLFSPAAYVWYSMSFLSPSTKSRSLARSISSSTTSFFVSSHSISFFGRKPRTWFSTYSELSAFSALSAFSRRQVWQSFDHIHSFSCLLWISSQFAWRHFSYSPKSTGSYALLVLFLTLIAYSMPKYSSRITVSKSYDS